MDGKTLVIIPAYNEEHNITDVLEEIRAHLHDADIVVIDDGSSDSTAEIAANRGTTVISLSYNLGIGAAMQTGYRYAEREGYDIAIQFDGDGQHIADQAGIILKPLLEGKADIVVGSRFLNRDSYDAELSRLIGISILSRIISFFIGQRITDPTSGFRAVNRNVIDFYNTCYPDDYPEPEALVLLHRAGFRIMEVPALMRKRVMGRSSITLLRGFYYMGKVLLAIMIDMLKKVPERR